MKCIVRDGVIFLHCMGRSWRHSCLTPDWWDSWEAGHESQVYHRCAVYIYAINSMLHLFVNVREGYEVLYTQVWRMLLWCLDSHSCLWLISHTETVKLTLLNKVRSWILVEARCYETRYIPHQVWFWSRNGVSLNNNSMHEAMLGLGSCVTLCMC